MTHQYKKLSVTMKMWMQFNVMPRTRIYYKFVFFQVRVQDVNLIEEDHQSFEQLRNFIELTDLMCMLLTLTIGGGVMNTIVCNVSNDSIQVTGLPGCQGRIIMSQD